MVSDFSRGPLWVSDFSRGPLWVSDWKKLLSLFLIILEKKMTNTSSYLLQFDGGAQPNPGVGAGAAVLFNNGVVIGEVVEHYEHCTNNFAEYNGLILGLEMALQRHIQSITVEGDSMLVIQQVQGRWKVAAEGLKPLCLRAKELLARFDDVILRHIPRAQNSYADALTRT